MVSGIIWSTFSKKVSSMVAIHRQTALKKNDGVVLRHQHCGCVGSLPAGECREAVFGGPVFVSEWRCRIVVFAQLKIDRSEGDRMKKLMVTCGRPRRLGPCQARHRKRPAMLTVQGCSRFLRNLLPWQGPKKGHGRFPLRD